MQIQHILPLVAVVLAGDIGWTPKLHEARDSSGIMANDQFSTYRATATSGSNSNVVIVHNGITYSSNFAKPTAPPASSGDDENDRLWDTVLSNDNEGDEDSGLSFPSAPAGCVVNGALISGDNGGLNTINPGTTVCSGGTSSLAPTGPSSAASTAVVTTMTMSADAATTASMSSSSAENTTPTTSSRTSTAGTEPTARAGVLAAAIVAAAVGIAL